MAGIYTKWVESFEGLASVGKGEGVRFVACSPAVGLAGLGCKIHAPKIDALETPIAGKSEPHPGNVQGWVFQNAIVSQGMELLDELVERVTAQVEVERILAEKPLPTATQPCDDRNGFRDRFRNVVVGSPSRIQGKYCRGLDTVGQKIGECRVGRQEKGVFFHLSHQRELVFQIGCRTQE